MKTSARIHRCCWLVLWTALATIPLSGCTRTRYRLRADAETYSVLRQKSGGTPWNPPPSYQVMPDPRSRFFDPTPPDDPLLPIPAPRLYAFELPELPARNPNRFRGEAEVPESLGPSEPEPVARSSRRRPPDRSEVRQVGFLQPLPPAAPGGQGPTIDVPEEDIVGFQQQIAPIAPAVWDSLPRSCLIRMFEFESVRSEFLRSFGEEPSGRSRDTSQRLALEDIVDLALVNSREYQTQKENLYNVALRLTLERYDYQLKFSNFGNGTDVNYNHFRSGGTTVNTLGIPTTVNGDKVLATGGDLLARFANDVVLTFNGPSGFAADVGSELLLDISQSVLQRDIAFENLTQSERDVVYAARDFARFRKQFFRNLASQYYALIRSYRGIEINTQDYFSNSRAFNQAQAEYSVGRQSRIQVDQIEQDVLRSRSNLIGSCNSLEQSFDNLKIQIGLPTELPINLDLTELEQLTLRDELTVSVELIRRSRRNLLRERQMPSPDQVILLNSSIDLTRKLLSFGEKRRELGQGEIDGRSLRLLLATLLTDEADISERFSRTELLQEQAIVPPVPPLRIFQRTEDLINSVLRQIARQLELAREIGQSEESIRMLQTRLAELQARHGALIDQLESLVEQEAFERIPEVVRAASDLLVECERLQARSAEAARRTIRTPDQFQMIMLQQTDFLLDASGTVLESDTLGLVPIDIDMDDAMLTALVQRFDLMNQQGSLADAWRQIKYAGDDLRSVLNLNASSSIRTRSDVNRVFDFTFDESQTNLSLTFDTPLNRKAQRNAFRRSLINYQAALRNVIALQDSIKLQVRDDLRNLQLDREQYRIAVASAALASERVESTRQQLDLNIQGVTARDFLEAQQAYTASLSSVATEHIGYIVDRIDLFLDLETLQVDDSGFWPELYDEQYQPRPNFARPVPGPVYGTLPPGILPSHKLKRMLEVPNGAPTVYQDPDDQDDTGAAVAPSEPIPPPPADPPPLADPPPAPSS